MWIQREAGTPLPEPIQGNIVDSLTQVGVDPTTNAASLRITKELNDKLNNIGDTTSYSNTVAGGSTNTWVNLISVPNLQNGVYMVTANVQCSKNLSSTLGSFSIAKNDNDSRTLRMKLESGGGGFLSYIFTINNANDVIKLKMYDNIDNTASYIAYMVICRIK